MRNFFRNVFAVIIGNILTVVLLIILLGGIILFSFASSFFQNSEPKNGSVLELTFSSPILESSMDKEVSLFSVSNDSEIYLQDILNAIKSAKEDEKIKGISLKLSNFNAGITQIEDIRNALEDFKKSGKFIYAYSHNSSQSEYYLNSVADSIFQNPLGMILLQGLSTEVMFYKNLGDKYGIDFQVIRHGAYKSAVEPYLRDDLSSENREQLSLLLNDVWGNFSNEVSASRKLPMTDFEVAVDSLYSFNSEKALTYKLVDAVLHEGEYTKILAKRLGIDQKEDESLEKTLSKYTIDLASYAKNIESDSSKDEIAVLFASGTILLGDGFSGIQSEIYKNAIRDLRFDENVKAVVLRINSPGGSADASEEILYELKELRKIKPIIVSFGDVAASGGYYIAMESDSIFANPSTITGSIGVLGMIPNVKKLVNNIGITTDYVQTNENSDFLKTVLKPMSPTGINAMTEMTEDVYKKFVGHVMESRNMTFEQVDSIGGGRVWSGKQALKIGLIDSYGTLEDAIHAAAQKVKIDKYSVGSYPYREFGMEEYLKQFQGVSTETVIKQELGQEYFGIYQQLKTIKEFKGVQLRMPFEIIIQ